MWISSLAPFNQLSSSFFFFPKRPAAIRSPKQVVSCVLLRTNLSYSDLLHNLIFKAWYHFGFHVRQPHKSNYIPSKARLLLLEPGPRGPGTVLRMVIVLITTTYIATFIYLPSQKKHSAGVLPATLHWAGTWRVCYQLVNHLAMFWRCKAAAKIQVLLLC